MSDRVDQRINLIQESIESNNKSALIERLISSIIFDTEKLKFIFPELNELKKN